MRKFIKIKIINNIRQTVLRKHEKELRFGGKDKKSIRSYKERIFFKPFSGSCESYFYALN